MKRFFRYTVAAIAVMVLSASFGTLHGQIIKGEVFLGGNLSQVDGDQCYGYKKAGFSGGAGALIPITNFMDIGLEVLFNQKGAFKRDSISYGSDYTGSYNLRLNYVEVPLMLYLIDKDKFSVGLGVSYGRLVGIKERINGIESGTGIGDGNLSWKNGYDGPDLGNIKDYDQLSSVFYKTQGFHDTIPISDWIANSTTYRHSDWGICADIRYRIYNGLHAELRYQYSLRPIRTRLFYLDPNENLIQPKHPLRLQYNNQITLRIVYIFNEQRSKVNKRIQQEKP